MRSLEASFFLLASRHMASQGFARAGKVNLADIEGKRRLLGAVAGWRRWHVKGPTFGERTRDLRRGLRGQELPLERSHTHNSHLDTPISVWNTSCSPSSKKDLSTGIKRLRGRLFVKNLPYDATEDDVAKLFIKCGKARWLLPSIEDPVPAGV